MGHWVWRSLSWWFQATKYGFETVVGSKYGLAAKYKWDGLAIVIFWKDIVVLDDFSVKLLGDSFLRKIIFIVILDISYDIICAV